MNRAGNPPAHKRRVRQALYKLTAMAGSQEILGARVGVDQRTVNSWIRAGRVPDWHLRALLAVGRDEVTLSDLKPELEDLIADQCRQPGRAAT